MQTYLKIKYALSNTMYWLCSFAIYLNLCAQSWCLCYFVRSLSSLSPPKFMESLGGWFLATKEKKQIWSSLPKILLKHFLLRKEFYQKLYQKQANFFLTNLTKSFCLRSVTYILKKKDWSFFQKPYYSLAKKKYFLPARFIKTFINLDQNFTKGSFFSK